jgi:hypothetical protein
VAGVDSAGLVTAHRPPTSFDETPAIGATFDGMEVRNRAIVRVVTETLGLDLAAYEQPDVVFLLPPQIGTFDYAEIFADYDVPRITQLAYQIERELTDQRPFAGDVQYFVNDPGHGADGTVPCGISGNPIRLGTDVDKAVHNSCLIVAYPPATPQWGVYFHEAGHNFTWASGRFGQFASASGVANSNFTYSEGLATAASMFAAQMLSQRAAEYGIPTAVVDSILASAWHFGSTPDLGAYLTEGAVYSQINPSVLDDMLDMLAGEYGYAFLYRLFSVFAPGDEPLPFGISGDTEQATVFIAAVSAATGTDQRERFHDDWGFPLDGETYEEIYSDVARLVAQRDPAADAGTDRAARPGQAVALDDAAVFDWAGRPVTVNWQVLSRPAGSTAGLSDPAILHPTFTPDLPGEYVLNLIASDDLLKGAPDTVRITARERPVYLPIALR